MFQRKDGKKAARKNLFQHYLLFVCLCFIAAAIGTEYASSYLAMTDKLNSFVSQDTDTEEEDRSVSKQWQLNTALTNALQNHNFDFVNSSQELLQQASEQISTKFGKHIEIGHENGVFASLTNQISSGAFLLTLLSALYNMLGSARAAAILLILLAFAVAFSTWLFVIHVFKVIYARFFLEGRIYRKVPLQKATFLISIRKWGKAAWTMFVQTLYYNLWLLTIIGGIIKYYSYFAVPYIVAENPDISSRTAITLSRNMMYGHKWECFKINLSLIGWYLLDSITFGLSGILYSNPYKEAIFCEYYAYVRSEAIKNHIPNAELLQDTYLYETAPTSVIAAAYGPLDSYPFPEKQINKRFRDRLSDLFGVYLTEPHGIDYRTAECQRIQYQHVKDVYEHNIYPAYLSPFPPQKSRSTMERFYYTRSYSIWSLIIMFFLFSLIGWFWEVSMHLIEDGVFVNRGVMHGPWLPIYGSGGVAALLLLKRLREKPLFEFLAAILLCGTLEYFIGWYLEKTHNGQRWWDYDGYFLNIDGRVCAEGLLVFGLGCVITVYFLAPLIDNLLLRLPRRAVMIFALLFVIVFCADHVYSSKYPNEGKGINSTPRAAAAMADYCKR